MISIMLLLHEITININFIDTNHNLPLLSTDKFVAPLVLCKTKNTLSLTSPPHTKRLLYDVGYTIVRCIRIGDQFY